MEEFFVKKGAVIFSILSVLLILAGVLLSAAVIVVTATTLLSAAPAFEKLVTSVLSALSPALSFSASHWGLLPFAALLIGWGIMGFVCRKRPIYFWIYPMTAIMFATSYLLIWSIRHPQQLHPVLQTILGTSMSNRDASLVVLLSFIVETLVGMVLALLSRMISHKKKAALAAGREENTVVLPEETPVVHRRGRKERKNLRNEDVPDEATVTFNLDENGREKTVAMGNSVSRSTSRPLEFPDLSTAPQAPRPMQTGKVVPHVENPEPTPPARRKVSRASDITDALFSAPRRDTAGQETERGSGRSEPAVQDTGNSSRRRSSFIAAALDVAGQHDNQPVASTKIFQSGQLLAAVADNERQDAPDASAPISSYRKRLAQRGSSAASDGPDPSRGFTLSDKVIAAEDNERSFTPESSVALTKKGRTSTLAAATAQQEASIQPSVPETPVQHEPVKVGAIPMTRRSSSEFKPLEEQPVNHATPVAVSALPKAEPVGFNRHSTAQPLNGAENVGDPAPEVSASDESSDQDMVSGIGWLASSNAGKSALYNRSKLSYQFPSPSLLVTYPEVGNVIDETIRMQGEELIETLHQFKVEASLINISKGPTVTMFEVALAPGIRVNSVINLADNIALNLAARQVRIQAPIPGKQAVGIEIPNKKRDTIGFKELLPALDAQELEVPVVLGKTTTGRPVVIDLATTPHLLIAGSTGSGKSVCVNALISSLLYRRSPKQVRLILVDPKVVELSIYNGIPHLLTPVITEAKKTIKALNFCLAEMDRRYRLLQSLNARNIKAYNKKLATERIAREKLPYIVVIIDEFADVMQTLGKDLEAILTRLAAMSRAVGIHLVLATQRPSMDVITGTIKSNIPSRIAFAVTSGVNSRIIIDESGAEKLLGRGDMLYMSNTDPIPTRIQGAFLSDDEVEQIVSYVRTQGEPDYLDESIFEDDEPESSSSSSSDGDDMGDDDETMMRRALEIVVERKCASASFLQRRLKIGYNRAARLVEEMEEMGYVGPANGSKPRELLRYPDLS